MSKYIDDEHKEEEFYFDDSYYNLQKGLLNKRINIILFDINTVNNEIYYNMSDNKGKKKKEKNEQIDEVKYNVFLMLTKKFRIDDSKYDEIIVEHCIKLKRLVIHKIEPIESEKEYIFIPEKNSPLFPYNNEIIDIQNKKYGEQKLYDSLKEIKKSKENDNKSKENDNKSVNSLEDKSNTEEMINNNISKSNKSSSKGDSSDNELFKGKKFYVEFENNNIFELVYTSNYEKEIDGLYSSHEEIKLISNKIDLDDKTINNLKNNYNNETNDLQAHLIYKNFESEYIPKNASIILEVKKSFDLMKLLNQIKKNAKILNNLKDTKQQLPKYIIGILCSFKVDSIDKQYNDLKNNYYHGTQTNILEHIIHIINKNHINVVIGAIKDEKIKDYSLSEEDYDINDQFKRVDIEYMMEKFKIKNISKNDISEIKSQIKYDSIHKIKTKEISMQEYNQFIFLEEKNKELEEKRKKMEEEKKKVEEEKKKVEDKNKELVKKIEEMKRMLEEKKK